MLTRFSALVEWFIEVCRRFEWAGPLLMRLFFGYFWLETGWAKLQNLAGFIERFIGWGIPLPAFSATVSAWTELLGGGLIMLGLFTRLTSIPMIINMVVAIAIVAIKEVHTFNEFVELSELLYILIFIWLMVAGPGPVSLDAWLARVFGAKKSAVVGRTSSSPTLHDDNNGRMR